MTAQALLCPFAATLFIYNMIIFKEETVTMNVQVEDLGKNMVKLTVEVETEAVDAAIKSAYNKQKNKESIINIKSKKLLQAN